MKHPLQGRAARCAFAAVICLLCLPRCAAPAPPPVFRIGMAADLATPGGKPSVNAGQLAVDECNAAGGVQIGGVPHRVELVVKDTQNLPMEAMDVGRRLVFQDDVRVLIGPNISHNAIPVATIAEQAGVPMISPGSTHPDTTKNKQYVFRMVFMDQTQGRAMAVFARERLKAARAAVLFDTANPSARSVAEAFREAYLEDGGTVTAFEAYATGADSFAAALDTIARGRPDVLFLPNVVRDLVAQVEAAKARGITATILGSDNWSPHRVEGLPVLEGAYFCHHWHAGMAGADAGNQSFVGAYTARYGEAPKVMSALTYDAFGLLFQVLPGTDGSSESLRKALAHAAYQGVTGRSVFSGSGDPEKQVVILKIEQGRVGYFETVGHSFGKGLAGDVK